MAYTADQKPSGLTALTSLATDDTIIVGDTSDTNEVVKKIAKSDLLTDLEANLDFATTSHTHTASEITDFDTEVANNSAVTANTAKVGVTTETVRTAGALMDDEITNLAQVKAFDATDYATAAQGALADSATQPGDDISTLTNDSGYITDYTVTESDVTAHEAALSITESQISDLQNYQIKAVVSGSLTAVNDTFYINVASATYTDPSPVEGEGFAVFVRNGTATIGGTGYSTAGTIVHRIYHSGAWSNYVYLNSAQLATTYQPLDADLTVIAGLVDPNADRILFWDDSAGAYAYLTASTGLTISGTNMTVRTSSATQTGIVELATDAETVTGTDTARATTPANITARLAAPGTIGGTTPGAATFTTVTTTGNIELGHASDTTISRTGAGAIAVEGVAIPTISSTSTLTNKTLTSNTNKLRFQKAITIEDPTSTEDISFFFTNNAITITEMRAVLVGSSTPSVTWTVRHGTDRSATGAEVVTSGTTTTSTTTGSDVTSFNDATIVADSHVWVETSSTSGTIDSLTITVFYTED